jgi:hypothetical protein
LCSGQASEATTDDDDSCARHVNMILEA